MRASLAVALLLSSTMLAGAEAPQKEFPAKLLGQALLPAETIIPAPTDAPADLKVSGKFVTLGRRVEPPTSGTRPTPSASISRRSARRRAVSPGATRRTSTGPSSLMKLETRSITACAISY